MQQNALKYLCLNQGDSTMFGRFDRYIDESLKAGTSSERTGGETARCKIADDTWSSI